MQIDCNYLPFSGLCGLESLLVPAGDRRSPRYSGYYLSIQTVEFAHGIELVSP